MIRSAHIRLQKRHVTEWYTLITNQREVWKLVDEETIDKLSANSHDQWAWLVIKRERATRLIRVMARQRTERQQMKWRHQQELVLLDESIKAFRKKSN